MGIRNPQNSKEQPRKSGSLVELGGGRWQEPMARGRGACLFLGSACPLTPASSRVFSPQLSPGEKRRGRKAGTKVWCCGGQLVLSRSSPSPRGPPPSTPTPPPPDPLRPRLGSCCGSSPGAPGEGGEGPGETGESSGGAASPAPPPPGLRSGPPPLCSLPARSRARRSRLLAWPGASQPPRRPPLRLPAPRTAPPSPRPSLARAGELRAGGGSWRPPCGASSGSWCWCSGRLPGH